MENSPAFPTDKKLNHAKTFAKIIVHRKWRNGYLEHLAKSMDKTGEINWIYVDKLSTKEAKEILCFEVSNYGGAE